MIRLVTGVPGAGKTYLAVDHLLKHYFRYDKENDIYTKQDDKRDVTIFTNITGLKLQHVNFDDAARQANISIEAFFTPEYQKKIQQKYKRIVYVIDEAQQYFHRRMKESNTVLYFDTHRHFGHDIYLITQSRYKISPDIMYLAEFEIRAVKRILSLAGELKYNILSDGEIIDRKVLKPNKKIYNLYESMTHKEIEKPKKPFVKYILAPLVLLIISSVLLLKVVGADEESKHTIGKQIKTYQVNTKPVPITELPVIDPPQFRWIDLDGVITLNDQIVYVLDPDLNKLVKLSDIPYKHRRKGRGVQVYKRIPNPTPNTNDAAAAAGAPLGGASVRPQHRGQLRAQAPAGA